MDKPDQSKRDFLKRAAYVPPAILLLQVAPAKAQVGSQQSGGGIREVRPGGGQAGSQSTGGGIVEVRGSSGDT